MTGSAALQAQHRSTVPVALTQQPIFVWRKEFIDQSVG
jgi:hypothetical protein